MYGGSIVNLASKDFVLQQFGDEMEWRRLWRSVIHFAVRNTAPNYMHVRGTRLSCSDVKVLIAGTGHSVCGAGSLRQYMAQNAAIRRDMLLAPTTPFAGVEVLDCGD